MKKQLTNCLILFFAPFILLSAQVTPQQIKALDAYIEKALGDWQTPGLAVVICKDGKEILSKGYGIREVGKSEKVDSKTIFACASTTKAMTAVAMGMLIDEGKIKWTDKVVQHLPTFKVADPYLTNELTIKDLFTHNSGMGNADFLWSYNDLNSNQILETFALMKPSYSLRGGYTYQNIMYLVVGKVIEKVSGMPWREFVKRRIFDPLSMARTFPTLKASQNESNRSRPHDRVMGKITPIEDSNADEIDAAGSVWSCVEDMSKWMRFMLDSARINGKPMLTAATYSELFKPQAIIPQGSFYPSTALTKPNWTTYGLGWFQHDYKGRMVQFHTGSLAGTVAIHGLLPSEKLGIYVFGNLDHTEVRHALMYRVFDLFLGEKERDWSKELRNIYDGFKVQAENQKKKKDSERVLNTKPSLDLVKYTGQYTDPIYGNAEVFEEDGRLKIRWSSMLSMTLEHWHFDTFKGSYNKAWFPADYVSFILSEDGKVVKMQSGGVSWGKK
jgi:CubicO group peptidase (beta-lactamase class C family)